MISGLQRFAIAVCLLALALAASAQTSDPAPGVETLATREEKPMPAGQETPLEALGLPRATVGGVRITGFIVGSFNYNSRIQLVPEFAGGGAALSDPGATNFRFGKFGLALSRVFSPWLSASAAMEVESHRDRHTHGFDPAFGCPGTGNCVERFGAEEPETHVNLDKFNVTGIIPIGSGLALSIGRFDTPFGIERHDEPLILTATTSEVFTFGRPNRMTGLQASYTFSPWLDVSGWVVNRWEAEVTDDDFNDNNHAKSLGGRIGITPISRDGLLTFGIGGFWGPEQDDNDDDHRGIVDIDATWTPIPRLLVAAEGVWGREENVSFRRRGTPISDPAADGMTARWWGMSLLAHYDFADFFGASARYGYFRDRDGARTGVAQSLESFTLAPVFHISRLIRDLGKTGSTFPRTRHPIDWVDIKLEYRWDHSNRSEFSDAPPATDILSASGNSQRFQLQVVVNF
ncbi:MAG TPA: outer membrane beta-barrel protein [Thermoanaerobaculia bacterium]|nr:outer membrane beta-barrel protein [Thermoanaerobaculia bacterium]